MALLCLKGNVERLKREGLPVLEKAKWDRKSARTRQRGRQSRRRGQVERTE